jgi:hypothetical protein
MLASCMVQMRKASTSKRRKGIHDENKQALARDETPRSDSLTH